MPSSGTLHGARASVDTEQFIFFSSVSAVQSLTATVRGCLSTVYSGTTATAVQSPGHEPGFIQLPDGTIPFQFSVLKWYVNGEQGRNHVFKVGGSNSLV